MNCFIFLAIVSLSVMFAGAEIPKSDKRVTTDELKELRKELFVTRGYDKHALPIPVLDQFRVGVRYNLINVRNLDIKTQTLTIDGWLFLQWHDESLKWEKDPKFNHIEVIRVPADEVYKPDVMLYNAVDHTTKKLVPTNALVYSKGLVMWVPPHTSKVTCALDLKKWPFDEHLCYIKMGSWTYDGPNMEVKSMNGSGKSFLEDFTKSPLFDVEFINVTNKNTYYPCCPEPYPSVTFYFKLTRKPTLYHFFISVPALVAIISSLVTFWFPIRSPLRFILNGISLLTLTLLLLHLSTELGFSSMNIPIGVRYLSLTTLLIGVLQIWFTIGYNISLIKCKVPIWTIKVTKPLTQLYKNSENEAIHLTQTQQTPDVSKKPELTTAEDLTLVLDKVIFVLFATALVINCYV